MRRPGWLIVLLAALIAGALSWTAAMMLLEPPKGVDAAWIEHDGAPPAGDELTQLRDRVEELERENDALRARPARVRIRNASPAEERDSGAAQEVESPGAVTVSQRAPWIAVDRHVPDDDLTFEERLTMLEEGIEASDSSKIQRAQAALRAMPDETAPIMRQWLRDTSKPSSARNHALMLLSQMGVEDLGPLIDEVLVRANEESALRLMAIGSSNLVAQRGGTLPTSVRQIALDPNSPRKERTAALRPLLQGEPDLGAQIIEDMIESGDRTDQQVAVATLTTTRNKDHLPLLTRTVNREDMRQHANDLINTIARVKDKPWSAKQIVGEPDTPIGGDLGTAWASKRPQMGRVWIELTYQHSVTPAEVRIHETLSPGAIAEVHIQDGSEWIVAWEGETSAAEAPNWLSLALRSDGAGTNKLRVILDTDRVEGWNEIDAVELIGAGGLRQWVQSASASSSYAN